MCSGDRIISNDIWSQLLHELTYFWQLSLGSKERCSFLRQSSHSHQTEGSHCRFHQVDASTRILMWLLKQDKIPCLLLTCLVSLLFDPEDRAVFPSATSVNFNLATYYHFPKDSILHSLCHKIPYIFTSCNEMKVTVGAQGYLAHYLLQF
jgi:hypothetical protein